MEPITHFLTGACLARAGLNRTSALATTTLVLAAEAADIDIVWLSKGPVFYFGHHRGITHTLVGVPFVAALTLGFIYALWRAARYFAMPDPMGCAGCPPSSAPSERRPRWGILYLLAVLAGLSHILLDYTNSYGVRPFMPFSYRWYSWDIVNIYDGLIWAVLLAGLLLPALFRLVNEEIGAGAKGPRGRAGAIFALVAIVLIWTVRDYEHRKAVEVMRSIEYENALPLRASAYPYAVSPFRWYGVAETTNFFEMVVVDSSKPDIDPQSKTRIRYKPEETPASLAAKQTYLGRVYLDWAQYPMTETEQRSDGTYEVRFIDLRYTYPERGSALRSAVILDKDLKELAERFGSHMQKVK
ncbi:MAG TPA: metal-dependent hydrolase [Terriglobales bacterium]|nr:metal-dependent hydrolase [Terriglobales bacterium]